MNFEDTVYVKTELGDARAKQPRSISSHELRATLLLIDGRITVREMKRRFGSSLAIDPAVSELLREGLIQAKAAPAVVPDEGEASEDAAPDGTVAPPDDAGVPTDLPDAADAVVPADPVGSPPHEARVEPVVAAEGLPVVADDSSAMKEPVLASQPVDDVPPALEVRPRLGDSTRGGLIAVGFFVERLWKGFLPALAVVLIGALVVGAFLLPERYRGEIEAGMAAYLGTPARFGGLRVALAGGGALQLRDVRVDALPSLQAAQVYLIPDWAASIRAVDWRFHVRITDLQGAPSAMARLLAAPSRPDMVTETMLERVSVAVAGEHWGDLSGAITQGEQGTVATLRDALGGLSVTAKRDGDALRIDAVAVDRLLPVFPQIPVNTLQIVGRLSDDTFDISSFGAAALDGKLSGSARLTWAEGARIVAEVSLGQINVERLLNRLGAGGRIGGSLSGDFSLEGIAAHPSEIRVASVLEGRFELSNGVLGGMDFGAAMRERGGGKIQGGETRFELLAGEVTRKSGALEIQVARLDAGALNARGSVQLGALEALSGQLSTVVGAGARRIRLPVELGGSLAAPTLEARLPAPAVVPVAATQGGTDEASAEAPESVSLEVPVAPGTLQ
ncbi:MAG: hypothetical protein R3E45_04035 [Rhodocyclaceae bacterium]